VTSASSGPSWCPRQAEADAIQRPRLERERFVRGTRRRIGGGLATGDERVITAGTAGLPGRAGELLLDDLDEAMQRLVAVHRPAVDEERRRPGDPERPGIGDVRLDRRAISAGIEVGAKPHHVEPELAREQLHGRAIDVAAERVQPIVHRQEPALGIRRERGLGGQRVVVVERQRAMDPAQQARIQPGEVIERALHAVAVGARVVAPRDDRHRRIDRTARRSVAARHLVDRPGIEARAPGVGRRARGR